MRNLRNTYRPRSLVALALAAIAVVGLGGSAAYAAPTPAPAESIVEIQILGINDFHGRLEADLDKGIAGAAVLAGAVKQLGTDKPNSVFVSAGDNVGGTTFTSFIANDEPTIRALTAAGLAVSTVGNHEFDQGYKDLTDRIIPSYGSAALGLGANVRVKATGAPALQEYAIVERAGIKIGFIGLVTEDTATSVTAEFVEDVIFEDQLQRATEVADRIKDDVDVTILLTHDGSPAKDCGTLEAEDSSFGKLVRGMNGKVAAVISGHTHNDYSCNVYGLPVVSSGFYGTALSEVTLGMVADTHDLRYTSASVIPLVGNGVAKFPADPTVAGIVADAVAFADAEGKKPIGKISADILRGGTPSGSDRGVESPLGNLIADIMYAKVPDADLAIVNPGSLREDLLYVGDGTLTYRDVASVQPFGNSLVAMTLTGAQVREILELQWYEDSGAELKRHLAVSESFSYVYDPDAPRGSRIGALALNKAPVADADTMRVVTNSFLAGGGDGFAPFAQGVNPIDSGFSDLQTTVEYFAAHALVDPSALGRAVAQTAPAPEPGPGPGPNPDPTPGTGGPGTPGASTGAADLAATGASHSNFSGMPFGVAAAFVALGAGMLLFAVRSARKSASKSGQKSGPGPLQP